MGASLTCQENFGHFCHVFLTLDTEQRLLVQARIGSKYTEPNDEQALPYMFPITNSNPASPPLLVGFERDRSRIRNTSSHLTPL